MIFVKIIGNDSSRSMFAVSSTKSIVHIVVSIRSKCFGKCFLTRFQSFLCCSFLFISCKFATGFAGFFLIEAKIFEQKHIAVFHCVNLSLSFLAILAEINLGTEQFAYTRKNLFERKFQIGILFGTSHVRHYDQFATVSMNLFERGKCAANTGIIGNVTVFIQRHIKVNAHDDFLACKITLVNCHIFIFLIFMIFAFRYVNGQFQPSFTRKQIY